MSLDRSSFADQRLKMKVVLDTNIFVSAFTVGGKPARTLDLIVGGTINGVTSERLISELTRVLGVKFGFDSRQLGKIESIIRATFTVVESHVNPLAFSRDPDDDYVLALAQNAQADFIVSGDRDLLILEQYLEIPIMTATDFLVGIADTLS